MAHRPTGRIRRAVLGSGAVVVLAGLNAPAALSFAQDHYHAYKIAQPGYQARYGSWQRVEIPQEYRTNAIHAALLHTGKVLIIAGSGNNQQHFDAGTFDTVLWDPVADTFEKVPTPVDFFCGGHAQLPDGRLLVAGGTARYEVLDGEVSRAGGGMRVKNENPDKALFLRKGTVFRSPSGVEYRSLFDVTVPRAAKRGFAVTYWADGGMKPWKSKVTAGEERVFVEAVETGPDSVTAESAQYEIEGLTGRDADNAYGLAEKITTQKQDFQGIRSAYEFDAVAEKYIRVDPMKQARWYPTLVGLGDGRVLAVSGLDDVGEIISGDTEIYDQGARKWSKGPFRYFPTYPALFLTKGGRLFYPGANAGYGPADKGRAAGLWDLRKNTFKAVGGLKDFDATETASSLMLPPVQDQKVMILGGGGVGESSVSTARTAVVDLKAKSPVFEPGPDLPQGTRYLNSVIMPDDTVFTTGGSSDYRGRGDSNILKAQTYDPKTGEFTEAAAPTIGRNYHSEALLLPDGRVATFGSDSLYGDKANTKLGTFEQRMEVFTPAVLHRAAGDRPVIGAGPEEVARGGTATYALTGGGRPATARLMRPSAVTHTTDVEQRSIALELRREEGRITVTVPGDSTLVPPGWYMLFVTDSDGISSVAKWVKVG